MGRLFNTTSQFHLQVLRHAITMLVKLAEGPLQTRFLRDLDRCSPLDGCVVALMPYLKSGPGAAPEPRQPEIRIKSLFDFSASREKDDASLLRNGSHFLDGHAPQCVDRRAWPVAEM